MITPSRIGRVLMLWIILFARCCWPVVERPQCPLRG